MFLCFLGCHPRTSDYWENKAKGATSPEEVFEASFHLNWYLNEDYERVGIDASFQFLTNKLRSSADKVRDQAASSLRWLNHPQKNQVLIEAYSREKVEDVQLGILFALCNTNITDDAVRFLTNRIEDRQFPHRWSAVRSLSVMNPSAIEPMLTNLLRDPDPKVVEEANSFISMRRNELRWTEGEPAKLLALARVLVDENGSNRSLDLESFPEKIAGKQIKSAQLYEKILILRLLDHNGGIMVNPSGKHEFPAVAVNRRLASPTEHPGIFEFVALFE
jgi:hypothetical protein